MAKKKPRTPTPPVQAPRRRYETSTRSRLNPRTLRLAAAGAAVVVAAIVIAVVAAGGGRAADPSKDLLAAGCSFKTFPNQGQRHVTTLTATVKYNSFPPTSGPHYFQPAPWNFYDGPVDSEVRVVHNLEHGGIVIQWGDRVPASMVEQLRGFWQGSPNGMLMAPLSKLGNKIALTAWTRLATCTRFNEGAFTAFRDAYRAKGPERFPLSALKPGS